jgi:hypothetical protein
LNMGYDGLRPALDATLLKKLTNIVESAVEITATRTRNAPGLRPNATDVRSDVGEMLVVKPFTTS